MVRIKRLGVLNVASFLGILGVYAGIIFGVLLFLGIFLMSTNLAEATQRDSISFSGLTMILLPVSLGAGGFLFGLIFTPFINLLLKVIKGLKVEIGEEVV